MNRKLRDFVGKARRLESTLATGVEGAARRLTQSSSRQPLEIVLSVVDLVESEIQPGGRGRRVFPFNQIRVQFAAPTPRLKAYFEVACEGPPSLHERIVERLEAAGCVLQPIAVTVSFTPEPHPDWSHADFDLDCARGALIPASLSSQARLELTVTNGIAARTVYVFEQTPISIGRGEEVRDRRQRLLRTNQVVFAEGGDEINQSVSRQHARVEHDVSRDWYRVFDDGSAHGTSVIRGGKGLMVPRGSKGLRLLNGDEIVLGQARLKVKF